MIAYGFGQRALIGGILIGIICASLSFFVVTRRLAFVGMGISHAAFGGVSIGIAAGINPIATAGIFCCLIALFIGWLTRKGKIHEDTAIGILFSAAMAGGVLLVRLAKAYNLDLMSYLFGSILTLTWTDVIVLAVMGFFVLAFIILFFKELLFFVFDEETALASGVPVRFVHYGLLLALALTIVISIKLVGIILVSALLVVPAAIGMQASRNYRFVILASLVASTVSIIAGLYLSSRFDLASGASVVIVLFAIFLLSVAFSPIRKYMLKLYSRK